MHILSRDHVSADIIKPSSAVIVQKWRLLSGLTVASEKTAMHISRASAIVATNHCFNDARQVIVPELAAHNHLIVRRWVEM